MSAKGPSFAEFCADPDLLGEAISPAWEVFYAAVEGLPLNREQRELFREKTGKLKYRQVISKEATAICGRRSQKTTTAIKYALWKALFGGLSDLAAKGDILDIPIIAQDVRVGKLGLDKAAALMLKSPMLSDKIQGDPLKHELRLRNGIRFHVLPCTFRSSRGFTAPLVVCDEVSMWPKEGASDEEVMRAVTPATLQFGAHRRIIKLSTPWRRSGVIYEDFRKRHERKNKLVWVASTGVMNPSIPKEELEEEKADDLLKYRREYECEFVDEIEGLFPPEDIESAIQAGGGRKILPFDERFKGKYVAALDASALKGRDRFAFGIGVKEDDGGVRLCHLDGWARATVAHVCDSIALTCSTYGIHNLVADQYASSFLSELLRLRGIKVDEFTFTTVSKQPLFLNLKRMLAEGRVRLLKHEDSLRELRSIEARKLSGGNYSISAPRGERDDYASVIALLANSATHEHAVWVGYVSAMQRD